MTHDTRVGEARLLATHLEAQRAHVLGILDGLDEAVLRRPALPSGWSPLGMVSHLADNDRFWFRAVVAADPEVIEGPPSDPWLVGPDTPVAEVLASYRREGELATAVLASTPLDAPPAWWPDDLFGSWRLQDVREIALHVLSETACHAGHLDVVRELVDGRQWVVLG